MDLGEMLAGITTPDGLDQVKRLVVREEAIRNAMAETGETREIVVEMVDAMESMDQESVLGLTDGHPTTLRVALTAWVSQIESQEPEVANEIAALLDYPWPDEEATIATHDANQSLRLEFGDVRDSHYGPQVFVGGRLVGRLDGDKDIQAAVEVVEAVHRAILARVIGDRDHHVQLSSTDRRSLLAWLERPNGSWRSDHNPANTRITVDPVQGGGILVRTRPYRYPHSV